MSLFDFFRYFKRPKRKPFSAWQIELTTRCPLNCRMCIREGASGWRYGDMRLEDFKKITPYFKDVETVILEGWGDSLLHKDFIEIIRLVKAEGAEAGFVTSGSILNRDYISELINAGIDIIGFSLSGVTPKTHELIRKGSDLLSLTGHIKTFNQLKADKGLEKPRLHLIYLMLKDNIYEIPQLPELAKEIGIKDIVLINLIHITNDWQESQRVFRCTHEDYHPPLNPLTSREGEYEDILKQAEAKANELGITLKTHPLSTDEVIVCEENPLRNLYISVDGEVSPCVYLYPPLSPPFKRIFCGKEYQVNKLNFGNIFNKPFDAIWNNKGYAEFRQAFALRKKGFDEINSYPRDLSGLNKIKSLALPEPPEPCRTCYKILGL